MGLGGGTRMVMACIPPRAARLSPARGPAAANGDTSSASPHHSKKTRRCTITAPANPFRQSARSALRRSALLKPCVAWVAGSVVGSVVGSVIGSMIGSVVGVEIVRLPKIDSVRHTTVSRTCMFRLRLPNRKLLAPVP